MSSGRLVFENSVKFLVELAPLAIRSKLQKTSPASKEVRGMKRKGRVMTNE